MKSENNISVSFSLGKRLLAPALLTVGLFATPCEAAEPESEAISRAFEMRYYTSDSKADGITDFKGPTEYFDVEGRMQFLREYADYAKRFFNDPELDTLAVTEEQVADALAKLKPQPLPKVRREIPLTDWKFLGYKDGQQASERENLEAWQWIEGMAVKDGALVAKEDAINFTKTLEPALTWRMSLSWKIKVANSDDRVVFRLFERAIDNQMTEAAATGFDGDGNFFYVSDGEEKTMGSYQPGKFYHFKVEVDLDPNGRRYNVYVDDKLMADFVPLAGDAATINRLQVETSPGLVLDDVLGYAYEMTPAMKRTGMADIPFSTRVFMDEDFSVRPQPDGFETHAYDDADWSPVPYWPYAHGGERHKGEQLYLRSKVDVGQFQRALLRIETVRPSGKLFLNGKLVKQLGRAPEVLDVTDLLEPDGENLFALQIDPHRVRTDMRHTPSDRNTSWFAGMMDLVLTGDETIDDVFTYTKSIGDPATQALEITLASKEDFVGDLRVEFRPWYPEESDEIAAQVSFPVRIEGGQPKLLKKDIAIPAPQLWTTETPQLYKVSVILQDKNGKAVDDRVFTTGIRTISQEGGVFRINGKPEMLNGPLVFQYPYPLEKLSQWMFRPPPEWIAKQILMVKNQSGNTIRLSMHDSSVGGAQDRRFAEMGDQLGIMYLWQTVAWLRETDLRRLDLDTVAKCVREVRNHPSIVVWQPSNHPTNQKMAVLDETFQAIHAVDQSRLISPTAHLRWLAKGQEFERAGRYPWDQDATWPFWTHPLMARGTMEQTTGYANNWQNLRELPRTGPLKEVRPGYLESTTHAWFDYENEESIGQPNWQLYRGKPIYKIFSYERPYDKGTIGRMLELDEWQEHQAYQAFSAYEAYRKKRWLGYGGLNWCSLRSGPNSGTYMKPMIDYYNHAKLAYHTIGMAFQDVLAGSGNVDTVYGPGDEIPVLVMNLGGDRVVDLVVSARKTDGTQIDTKRYSDIELKQAQQVVKLPPWKPTIPENGHYIFEYRVLPADF